MTVTMDDVNASRFEYTTHINRGRDGYGYGYQCVEYPRLSVIDRTNRKTRALERTWYVDGGECKSFAEAVERLNRPVVLTEEEGVMLARIPDQFVPLRELRDELAGSELQGSVIEMGSPHSKVMTVLYTLNQKGMVEHGREPWKDSEREDSTLPEHLKFSPTIRRRKQS